MSERMKRMIGFGLAFVLLAAVACGAAEKNAGLTKVTVLLDWVPNTNHTGLYVAKQLGYYKEQKLDVNIIQPFEGGGADLIAAGKGDFAVGCQEQVTYALTAEHPLPITAVAAIIQHNTSGFASPAAKGIKNPKDFEGKIYGGWGSPMEEAMLKGTMKKSGADFSKLRMVNIGEADFFASVQKDVDFSWIYFGWDGVAAQVRNFPIHFIELRAVDPRLDYYTPLLITSHKMIKENPALIRKFLQATAKGYHYAIQKPQAAAGILVKAAPEIDRKIAAASQKYLAQQYIADAPRWGEMKESIWKGYADWMLENGLIKKRLVFKEAYTNEFLPSK